MHRKSMGFQPYDTIELNFVWAWVNILELRNNAPTLMLKSKNFTTNQRYSWVFFNCTPHGPSFFSRELQPGIQGGAWFPFPSMTIDIS